MNEQNTALYSALKCISKMTAEKTLLEENAIPEGFVAIPQAMFIDLMNGKNKPYLMSMHWQKMTGGNDENPS